MRLIATDPVHLVRDGLYIKTPEISVDKALVDIDIEIFNDSDQPEQTVVATSIIDPNGKVVAASEDNASVRAGEATTLELSANVANPSLWDTDTPHLYALRAELTIGAETVDTLNVTFGIREMHWVNETGFWLNGKNIKLKGVSDHLEAGPVGAAIPDELIRRKIQLLQEMGCNAIRCAHNPQVRRFYEIWDEMGMLVMDEIFDGWKQKAAEQETGAVSMSRFDGRGGFYLRLDLTIETHQRQAGFQFFV